MNSRYPKKPQPQYQIDWKRLGLFIFLLLHIIFLPINYFYFNADESSTLDTKENITKKDLPPLLNTIEEKAKPEIHVGIPVNDFEPAYPFQKDHRFISIIFYNVGQNLDLIKLLQQYKKAFTLAFYPYLDEAETIYNNLKGSDFLLHVPIEHPYYPQVDSGYLTLLSTKSIQENQKSLNFLLEKFQNIVGILNTSETGILEGFRSIYSPLLEAIIKKNFLLIQKDIYVTSDLKAASLKANFKYFPTTFVLYDWNQIKDLEATFIEIENSFKEKTHLVLVLPLEDSFLKKVIYWVECLKEKNIWLVPLSFGEKYKIF